jgi:hypothetical protein
MPQAVHNDASSLRLDAKNRKNIIARLIEGRASAGEQAKARVRTARASSQSLAEQFADSIIEEILYARLFCGLRFFNKNHKITTEFPPCAVKQVCSIIATAKSQGRTTEEVLAEEMKLAANGLEKLLNASPHALCFTCANRFCPIKNRIV